MAEKILIYASAVPADNMANLTIPKTGKIVAVSWHVAYPSAGADYAVILELSSAPVAMATINGNDQMLSMIKHRQEFTTSGVVNDAENFYDPLGDGWMVNQGERLYLNGSGTAISVTVDVFVLFNFILSH